MGRGRRGRRVARRARRHSRIFVDVAHRASLAQMRRRRRQRRRRRHVAALVAAPRGVGARRSVVVVDGRVERLDALFRRRIGVRALAAVLFVDQNEFGRLTAVLHVPVAVLVVDVLMMRVMSLLMMMMMMLMLMLMVMRMVMRVMMVVAEGRGRPGRIFDDDVAAVDLQAGRPDRRLRARPLLLVQQQRLNRVPKTEIPRFRYYGSRDRKSERESSKN